MEPALLHRLNQAGTANFRKTVPIKELPDDEKIVVEGVKKVTTRYGQRVVLEIPEKRDVFLPRSQSQCIQECPEIWAELESRLEKRTLYFKKKTHGYLTVVDFIV